MEYIDFPMSLIFCLISVASFRLFNRFSSAEKFDLLLISGGGVGELHSKLISYQGWFRLKPLVIYGFGIVCFFERFDQMLQL